MARLQSYSAATMAAVGSFILDGYYGAGTLGGGVFVYKDPCPYTTDAGFAIAPSGGGTGCLVRQNTAASYLADWWGCRTGVDCAAAINAAIAASAANSGSTIPVYYNGDYSFSTTISDATAVPLILNGTGTFTGSGAPAVVFGGAGVAAGFAPASTIPSHVRVLRANTVWGADPNAGIEVINVNKWNATLAATGFYIGVDHQATAGHGSYYNNITLGALAHNQYDMRLHMVGTINQNNYYGGNFDTAGQPAGFTGNTCGVWFDANGTYPADGNTWYSPSFELTSSTAGHASDFCGSSTDTDYNAANGNNVYSARDEGTGTHYILSGTGITRNYFSYTTSNTVGASSVTALNPDSGQMGFLQNNSIVSTASDQPPGVSKLVRVGGWDRKDFVTVGGYLRRSSDALIISNPGSGQYFFNADPGYSGSPIFTVSATAISSQDAHAGLGGVLDLAGANRDYQKGLYFFADAEAAGGRFCVMVQKVDGTILTSTDDAGPSGPGEYPWIYNANKKSFCYREDFPAGPSSYFIGLGPDVKLAGWGVWQGNSADFTVRSVSVYAPGASGIKPLTSSTLLTTMNGGTARYIFPGQGEPYTDVSPDVSSTVGGPGTVVRSYTGTVGQPQYWVLNAAAPPTMTAGPNF